MISYVVKVSDMGIILSFFTLYICYFGLHSANVINCDMTNLMKTTLDTKIIQEERRLS